MPLVPRVEEVANRTLPLVGADQSLSKAAEVMLATGSQGVVTADVKRRPMLVLSYRGLVRAIARDLHLQTRISEVAVDEPVTVRAGSTVIEALGLMKRTGVRFLPVVDERSKIIGVFEPRHAAESLWDLVDYGQAMVEARLRKLVALSGDVPVRVAAKAMDENGVPEVLVRLGDELRILREEDFLRAVAEERVDAPIRDYARGRVIRVPPDFDAKSAVSLMLENQVRRLLVDLGERQTFVTLTDLAFEAAEIVGRMRTLETGFVLVKTETGRERDVAEKAILTEGVREVFLVAGDYDILVRVEAPTIRDIHAIVSEALRRMPGVIDTVTLAAFRVAARRD